MHLHHLARAALFATLPLQFCACAASNAALRSQPAGFFTVTDYPVKIGDLDGKVTLRCAKVAVTKYQDSTATKHPNLECDSLSADLTGLTTLSDQQQTSVSKDVINLLLAISDYNCSNFLSRSFSTRSTLDFASKLIADLATGASAGTVAVSPGVSAGFSGLNLLVGKTDSEFNSVYYTNQTFTAMEKAIAAERTKRKTDIIARRDGQSYLVTDAISDSRYYDDACSLKAGLDSLNTAAENENNKQQANQLAVTMPQAKDAASKQMLNTLMNLKRGMQIALPPDNAQPPK